MSKRNSKLSLTTLIVFAFLLSLFTSSQSQIQKIGHISNFSESIITFEKIDPEISLIPDKDLDNKLKRLRNFVNDILKDSKVPGLALGIVKDGKVVFAEGIGYRNLEQKLPVTAKTLFAIGSCT